jgi:membrane associated rhomboid family serine protease
MIPLRDDIPHRTFPFVNTALIIANVIVFIYEINLANRHLLEKFIFTYGMVPARVTASDIASYYRLGEHLMPFFTSMFLHGGWLHIVGNMLFLYIFGDNVEDRVGHVKYFIFYVLCGCAAALTHVVTNPGSRVPTIGASGAIAGVMGAYLVLFPRARVLTLIPIFFFFDIIEIPAFFFLGIWFIIQFFVGTFGLATGGQEFTGIAWWAHVGGFVSGIVLVPFLKKRRATRRQSVSDD